MQTVSTPETSVNFYQQPRSLSPSTPFNSAERFIAFKHFTSQPIIYISQFIIHILQIYVTDSKWQSFTSNMYKSYCPITNTTAFWYRLATGSNTGVQYPEGAAVNFLAPRLISN
jgi:hypothetical protein